MRAMAALFLFAGLLVGLAWPAEIAHAADAATEEARQHFLKGQQLFDVGRWDEAAEEFEKAYSLRGDPSFIYNMAQAYRRKGDAKRALDLYKNYLIKAPKSPQRAEVENRVQALQKQIEEAEYRVGPPTPSVPSATLPTQAPPAAAPPPAPTSPAAPVAAPPPAPTSTMAPAAAPPPAPVPAVPVPAPQLTPQPAAAVAPAPAPERAVYAPVAQPVQGGYPAPASVPGSGYSYPSAVAPIAPRAQPGFVQVEATPVPETEGAGHGLRVGGIVCGSAGVAAIGAGIFFGAEASAYSRSVESGSVFNPNFDSRGKLYETLQWVGYGIGAGLIATGATLYIIGAVSANSRKVALAPTVFPGGAGLGARGEF